MKLYRWTAPLALAGVLALFPASATAASGWKLPAASSKQGKRVITNTGRHCGADRFGTYRFKNVVHVRRRTGSVIFKARITPDGRLHEPRFKRFGGRLPKKLRRRTRFVLRKTRYRYAPGSPARIESVWPDGRVQAARAFNPVRASVRC